MTVGKIKLCSISSHATHGNILQLKPFIQKGGCLYLLRIETSIECPKNQLKAKQAIIRNIFPSMIQLSLLMKNLIWLFLLPVLLILNLVSRRSEQVCLIPPLSSSQFLSRMLRQKQFLYFSKEMGLFQARVPVHQVIFKIH